MARGLLSAAVICCCLIDAIVWGADQTTLPSESPAVAPFSLADAQGKVVALDDYAESKLIVLAFLGTECPLSKLYAGRLEQIARQYDRKDVAVIALDANVQDSVTELAAFTRRLELSYPLLKDLSNKVADQLEVRRNPDVLLLDEDRKVQYRGRIDDQYGIGIVRDKPQREELKAAIDELLSSRPVSVARTEPVGCLIGRVQPADESSPVTYSGQIARIFNEHCVECHRQGEIAPFSLSSYDDVVGWGEMISEVVRERRMPPWHASPNYGKFANDCSLSEEEQQLIHAWVKAGCPKGDDKLLPAPRRFVEGWQLERAPDRVYAMQDQPYVVPAQAGKEGMAYQNFWVDPGFTEDTWISALEVRPGNRAVVHHIVIYLHPHGKEENFQGFRDGRDFYYLGSYVPGQLPGPALPAGAARKIPAGTWFRFEIHYVPVGTEQSDLSQFGVVFADPTAVTHEVRMLAVLKTDFRIEPQLDNQQFDKTSGPLPFDMQLIGFFPHMHLRGKSFRYTIEQPGEAPEIGLDIPRYDFSWQTHYVLAEPRRLPESSRITIRAGYDNSPSNLANPDPTATVTNGAQSWDEMMVGYIEFMFPKGRTVNFPFGFL